MSYKTTSAASALTRVDAMIGLHGRNAWFKMPWDQEIKVKGLDKFAKEGMNEFGGIVDIYMWGK